MYQLDHVQKPRMFVNTLYHVSRSDVDHCTVNAVATKHRYCQRADAEI